MKRNRKLHEPDLVGGEIVVAAETVVAVVANELVAEETGGKTLSHSMFLINRSGGSVNGSPAFFLILGIGLETL